MPNLERGRLRVPAVVRTTSIDVPWRPLRSNHRFTNGRGTDDHADVDPEPDPRRAPDDGPETAKPLRADGSGSGADERPEADQSTIEFLDCETVCVRGEYGDVVLSLFWWEPDGLVGTIAEPVGGVDGERTIVASDEFGEFAHGPIISGVDAYRSGTPIVPGGGDVSTENPNIESCVESVRKRYDGEGDLQGPFPK